MRIISLIMCLVVLLTVSACSKNKVSSESDDVIYEYEYVYQNSQSSTSSNNTSSTSSNNSNNQNQKTKNNSSSNTSKKSDAYIKHIRDESELFNNSYYKIINNKKLNIAYLGGSITYGYGSSDTKTKSFRAITTDYFKNKFKDVKINETDASIGGTGSEFGAYRAIDDLKLTTNEKPDLVFIEFAINDVYDNSNSKTYIESIIRTIYKYNPYADIVLLFTTDFGNKNNEYDKIKQQKEVADYYGIPYLHIGEMLYNDIVKENNGKQPTSVDDGVWKKYFYDSVHPNDNGYKKYAEYIENYFNGIFMKKNNTKCSLEKLFFPTEPLTEVPYNPYSFDFSKQSLPEGFYNEDDGSISCNKSGSSLYFTFTGTEIKIWAWATETGGSLKIEIDDEEIKQIELHRSPANHTLYSVAENLSNKKHSVRLSFYKSTFGSDMKIQKILISGSDNMKGISVIT